MRSSRVEKYHQEFLNRLRRSHGPAWVIGYWFWCQGHAVCFPPQSEAPTHSQWRQHKDQGDFLLQYLGRPDQRWHKVQAKKLNYEFTGEDDWLHGDSEGKRYMICPVYQWDNEPKKKRPSLFVFANPAMTHAGIVRATSAPLWFVAKVKEKARPELEPQDCYFCRMKEVEFVELNAPGISETAAAESPGESARCAERVLADTPGQQIAPAPRS